MKNKIFDNENLYYIGGVVRDEILGVKSLDIDLTYDGDAIEFCKKLEASGEGKIIKINEAFNTVRMVIDGKEVDIASTRDEIYEKKGHLPTVTNIGCSLKQDVLRRDFTVNSLAKSVKTGEITDYTGGISDLNSKILRVLHDNSFTDDPTRIIRGLKFAVRFNLVMEPHTKFLQDKYLENVNYDMSYKRLKKELIETFNLNIQRAFDIFINEKLYKLLTDKVINPPEYNIEQLINKYPVKNVWLVYLGWIDDIDRLPLNKEEFKIIEDFRTLISTQVEKDDFNIYKKFSGKSEEAILLYKIIKNSDDGLRYFSIKNISPSISGNDLKVMGIAPSAEYSECFDFVLKNKLKNPELTKDDEIKLAKQFFNM